MSDKDLADEEEGAVGEDNPTTDSDQSEDEALERQKSDDEPEEPEEGFYSEGGAKKISGRGLNKKAAAFMAGGGAFLIIALLFILFLLSVSKSIHFSTILRTTGFATSQAVMREAFSEQAYSDWATNNETVELPKSKLLDKVRGRNMRKIQQKLQEKGEFKYTLDAKGNVDGFNLRGEDVKFDELAKKLDPNKTFDQLSYRERLSVRKYVTDKVKFEMADTFDADVRGFRNGFWKGFREATGIKMTTFRDVVRGSLGDKTVNSKLDNDTERIKAEAAETRGTDPAVGSSLPEVDEAAKDVNAQIRAGADIGVRTPAKVALTKYLEGKGHTLEGFENGMSEVSTAVLVTSLYCMAHDLSHTSDRINQQMEKSMARFGHRQQTEIDQIKNGDATAGDVAFAGKEWSGDGGAIKDATNNPLYEQAIGKSNPGGDVRNAPRANISLPLLDWIKPVDEGIRTSATFGLNKLDPTGLIDSKIDSATTAGCGIVMNPYTQGGILAADVIVSIVTLGTKELVTKALVAVVFFAGFKGLGDLIQSYINQVAGAGVTGTEIGSDKVSAGFVSTDYLNSQTSRGVTYGAPQTNDEASSTKQGAIAELRNHYKQGNLHERYFALSNPYSLFGTASAYVPSSVGGLASTTQLFLTHLGSTFAQSFSNVGAMLGGAKASAASNIDVSKANEYFGVKQWGWTNQELGVMRNTNEFDNAVTVEADMEKDPQFYSDLEQCYNSAKLLYELADSIKSPNCTTDTLKGSRALQWRIYKLHEFASDQTGSEGINEGSVNTTAPSGSTAPPSTPGQYVNPLSQVKGLTPERIDQGVDYAGSGPILALGAGTVLNTVAHWPGGTFIAIKLEDGPAKDRIVFVAENCKPILVSIGQHVTAGQPLCTLINFHPNLEIGWASNPQGGAAASGCIGSNHNNPSAYGINFSELLVSLGAPPGIKRTQNVKCTLPADWPTWK